MGKRGERTLSKDKEKSASISHDHEDDSTKTPELYNCTGQFQNDFNELCRRHQMSAQFIPPVMNRPKRPPSPSAIPVVEEKTSKSSRLKKDDKSQQQQQQSSETELDARRNESSLTESHHEPPPKTYLIKDSAEYFKPCIQVEMDNPDKADTVTEVYIQGWKIDSIMMSIFRQCFPRMERLRLVNFFNTALSDEVIETFASFIQECPNLKTLILDNNPTAKESWHLLIKDDSPIQHLSIRYNSITDIGAKGLGNALGNLERQNRKLLTLDLTGNKITCDGAISLANGLRLNRTLLTLNLSSNNIGDKGAQALAEVLSRFELTHEEVVTRRKLNAAARKPASPPHTTKRSDSKDRPGSVRSTHATTAKPKTGRQRKGESKASKDEDSKHEKTKGKSKETEKSKKASIMADSSKTSLRKPEKGKLKKGNTPVEPEPSELVEEVNPLLDTVESLPGGMLLLKGNMTLISLNLARNRIGLAGIEALRQAVVHQTSFGQSQTPKPTSSGLMRLCIQRNNVLETEECVRNLQEMMKLKDPLYKPAELPSVST